MSRPPDRAAMATPGTPRPAPASTAPSSCRPTSARSLSPSDSPPPKPSPSHRPRLRPPLAQRPHARRPQSAPASWSSWPTAQRHRRHRHQRQPHRFPDDVARAPPRCASRAGRPISREDILLALLPAIDSVVRAGRATTILARVHHCSSYASGLRVRSISPTASIEGVTAGLDPTGFLIVRHDDGTDTLILAGGVRAARS